MDGRPDDTRSEAGFAAVWSADGVTRSLSPSDAAIPADLPFLFAPGQHFGPYLIVRPIGKGGMGQVYEAEETDSGRRVAIKILSRGLGDDEERERFLQEGRLAASLSHPNTVYVFGTTEVQGFPVIAMELAPSGTLKDLVTEEASLPPSRAVDAILQVIDGLEAAAALGILHRDIKPSNCFVAADGRVLVGDFGLSIATLARGTADGGGTILGTPGFASPEQLRGDALDVRSDIYSVGATIYYLLAGKPPFDGPNLTTTIERVANEPPPALTLVRSDLPSRLVSIVTRCLAKKPADRYATYAVLRSALEPFRSASVTPAPLLRRWLAGVVDLYVGQLPVIPVNMYLGTAVLDTTNPRTILWSMVPAIVMLIAYYTILEGLFGCAAGKAVFNLRVVDRSEAIPGVRRALLRAAVFVLPPQALRMIMGYYLAPLARPGVADATVQTLLALAAVAASAVVFGLQFSTVRRRNGFAALHDLLSGTRVVVRPRAMEARASAPRQARDGAASFDGDRVGPYLVPRGSFYKMQALGTPLVVEGFDDRLRRPVWVELQPEGTPPVAAWRRDLGRPSRIRWLSGRRQGADCWDAYEAVDGVVFRDAIATPQPWTRVRHWMADLGVELAASMQDGQLPPLAVDRVWIGADDRARLLDLDPGQPAATDPARFLHTLAVGALRGEDPDRVSGGPIGVPLPLAARTYLASLRDGGRSAAELAAAADLLRVPARIGRSRRAAQIAVCACLPLLMPAATIATFRIRQNAQTANPRSFEYEACLDRLLEFEKKGDAKLTPAERDERDAIEVYIAERLQDQVNDAAEAARTFPVVTRVQGKQSLGERAVARHPRRTPAEVTHAETVVARLSADVARSFDRLNGVVAQWAVAVYIAIWTCLLVACLSMVGALVTGSGFAMRGTGGALVTARGENASRLRALWRAIVVWSPLVPALLLVRVGPKVREMSAADALAQTLPLLIMAAGALWAIRTPECGLQDRLAGTRIVPR